MNENQTKMKKAKKISKEIKKSGEHKFFIMFCVYSGFFSSHFLKGLGVSVTVCVRVLRSKDWPRVFS